MYKVNAYEVQQTHNVALTGAELKLQDNTITGTKLNGGIISIIPSFGTVEYRKDYYGNDGVLVTGDWVDISEINTFMAVEYNDGSGKNGSDYLRVSGGTGRVDVIKWM